MTHRAFASAILAAAALSLIGCTTPAPDATQAPTSQQHGGSPAASDQKFPEVVKAELTQRDGGFLLAVTISSPYDTPERYADGWRVKSPDGAVLAEHTLGHDHANEQPFTRTQGPFAIPDGVNAVVVEGRDKANGYGGKTVTVTVPR